MEIAVVDDEKAIREHIRALIEERQPEGCIEAYSTGEEPAGAAEGYRPHIHHGI